MFVPKTLLMPDVARFCAPATRSNGPVTISASPLPTPCAPTVKSRNAPPTLVGSSAAGRLALPDVSMTTRAGAVAVAGVVSIGLRLLSGGGAAGAGAAANGSWSTGKSFGAAVS
jgi:hypothetical protein